MRFKKLDSRGAFHLVLPLIVASLVAGVGVWLLVDSQAQRKCDGRTCKAQLYRGDFIDISSPQCSDNNPTSVRGGIERRSYGIVGLNGHKLAFNKNPCLRSQVKLFKRYGFYVGTNYPSAFCSSKLSAYKCGQKAGRYNVALARSYNPDSIWIDVEAGDRIPWNGTQDEHRSFIRGMYDTMRKSYSRVGYYSLASHWNHITGGMRTKAPIWYAVGKKSELPAGQSVHDGCRAGFGGQKPTYVQYISSDGLDHNITC